MDLDTYEEEITTIFNQQKTNDAIRQEFAYRYSVDITDRTLARRLQQCGLCRLPSKTADNIALCERIRSLICDNLSDREILLTLHREGFQISQDT